MGAFTTLYFCRPMKPPRITGVDLALFLRRIAATGAMTDRPVPRTLEIKFGEAIDEDDKPSDGIERTSETVGTTTSIKWDLDGRVLLSEMLMKLERETRPIYRANVELGGAAPGVIAHMHRPPTSDGVEELALDGWFLQIGPVRVASRVDDLEFDCGWIAVSMGGNGSLFPATPRELVDRALLHNAVLKVTELCRAMWPVPREPATPAAVDGRSLMRDQWCTAVYAPIDWFWTVR